jgi:hypothetical protein
LRALAGKGWPDPPSGLALLAVVAGHAFVAMLLGCWVARAVCGRRGVLAVLRALTGTAALALATVAMVAGAAVVQPTNPFWPFLLHPAGQPLAWVGLAWLALWPLVVALFLVLLPRFDQAQRLPLKEWQQLEIGQ